LIRWVYGKEECSKCRGKLKTNIQYEIVSKTDRSCVPNLAGVGVTVKLEKCRRKAMEDTSVPVHTIYKNELSDILTRWYDMITEIPKYDNVKTRLSRTAKGPGHWANSGRQFENCISGRHFTSVK
jgi:hypothetical protein